MDEILQYIRDNLPPKSVEETLRLLDDLTHLRRMYSLPDLRYKIREQVKTCPTIVQVYSQGTSKYFFKRACTEVVIDNLSYHVPTALITPTNIIGYMDEIIWLRDSYTVVYLPSYEDTQGHSHRLSTWITEGEICDECGGAYIHTSAPHSEHICQACTQTHEPLRYDAQADQILGFEETKEILFGIELEYEGVTSRQVMNTLKGHAIAKRDGTIRSGVEVVTRPACIKTHKEKLSNFFKNVRVKSEPNTGMHVHVEKARLTNYQIGFMLEFLNKDSLETNLHLVAGREYSSNTYCRRNTEHKMTWGGVYNVSTKRLTRERTTKYSPLNTNKPATVEFRIFASPANMEECAARLDFVNALVHYSSPYSYSVKTLKDKFIWDNFLGYITKNRKDYPDFYKKFINIPKTTEVIV